MTSEKMDFRLARMKNSGFLDFGLIDCRLILKDKHQSTDVY
jgi:hypothetical protein